MTRPSWSLGEWTVFAAAVTVAAAGFVGLLVWSRTVFGLAVAFTVVGVVCWRLPNRALRRERDEAVALVVMHNNCAIADDRAEVRSDEFEVPGFMADSGYRAPEPDPEAVWCVQLTTPDAPWCALYEDREPGLGEVEVETRCGWMGDLPAGLERRRPTCGECLDFGRYDEEEAEDNPHFNAWAAAVHDGGPRTAPGSER